MYSSVGLIVISRGGGDDGRSRGMGEWPRGVCGPSDDETVSRDAKDGTRLNDRVDGRVDVELEMEDRLEDGPVMTAGEMGSSAQSS